MPHPDPSEPAPEPSGKGPAVPQTDEDAGASSQSILHQLEQRIGRRPQVRLREIDSTRPDAEEAAPSAAEGPAAGEAGRYRIEGLLGEGGVGVVHRGRDLDLGRDVAMKFLHERYRDHAPVLHRFVEEAQIGGQLQHPGIVPVYELGIADGKPFFAMKMIRGKTLAARLAERATPADDLGLYLSYFEHVCQTMAYAHARGVVHRDLKPANVMIGDFGEVQVVDWGMGKVLSTTGGASDEEADHATDVGMIETLRSRGEGTQSVMGSVMGTPAYMPPEQAIGDVEAMDARSDVFALGAILCEILTGQPPYTGPMEQLLVKAATAKLDDARSRLAACGAEGDLVDLALRCLSPTPDERPSSAEAVAKAVQSHLSGAEARAHEANVRALALKRTQKYGIALTVVVTLGLAVSLGFWREADQQRARAEDSATAAAEARSREADARQAAETHLANFDRLSYVVRLEDVRNAAQDLHPAWPGKAQAMHDWLDGGARQLREALPDLRATVATLEAPEGGLRQGERAAADDFLQRTLGSLVSDIEAFAATEIPAVERRLRWAERVEALSIARHAARWEQARQALLAADGVTASERYAEVPVDLPPQMGLVPIGMNPQSKLWEFYHLRSAWDSGEQPDPEGFEIPTPDASGRYAMDGRGIVFVLIPGGRFPMGAQGADPSGPNHDPSAEREEAPVTIVELGAYFLSKYELTQGQWARLTDGERPSWYLVGDQYNGIPVPIADSHPVEQVDWPMCAALLPHHGLTLPTEAQWEYGCRAGTTSIFAHGDEPGSLEGFANVLDQTGQNVEPVWSGGEAFDDRFKGPAPVGTYAPNAFGLYDMHGNVSEWCRDWFVLYVNPPRVGDGLRDADLHEDIRASRGGSYLDRAHAARSAFRSYRAPLTRTVDLGVRAAREVLR